MSRSTVAKSRADKATKSGYGSAPTPAVTHEIVAGKFNDQDWNAMLDHDDGDDFLHNIVGEICSSALDVIYQNYLQKQLVPYTVLQAKDALLQIVEWQFLARDEGEIDVDADSNWLEDEEPAAAVTDCWAQGSVPINMLPPTPRTEVMEPLDEDPELDTDRKQEETDEIDKDEELSTKVVEEESSIVIEESAIGDSQEDKKQETSHVVECRKKKKKYKPHSGPLPGAKVDRMTESLEQMEMHMLYAEIPTPPPPKTPETAIFNMPNSCHSIIKLQAGRPPGTRDVIYDYAGNVVSITKLNPERLPNHRVKTGYEVVDPQVEAAQARLEAMRTGRHLKAPKSVAQTTGKTDHKTSLSKEERSQINAKRRPNMNNSTVRSSQEDVKLLPPPLIDSMEVSPGVVVRERDRIKRGPKSSQRADVITFNNRNLRPVVVRGRPRDFSIQDLLGDNEPVIRHLGSPSIPPIVPHPPAQKAS